MAHIEREKLSPIAITDKPCNLLTFTRANVTTALQKIVQFHKLTPTLFTALLIDCESKNYAALLFLLFLNDRIQNSRLAARFNRNMSNIRNQ